MNPLAPFRRWRRDMVLIASILVAVPAMAATTVVVQKNRAFSTKSIDIAAGDTVNFTNDDEFIHQIFIDAKTMRFDSPEQNPGETIALAFPTSGTFQVMCHIHPKMSLTVNVK